MLTVRNAKYIYEIWHVPAGYQAGWNVRYTTDLTEPVWFYLRGEEYSAQLDYFVCCIEEKRTNDNVNSFENAMMTDRVIAMMIADAEKGPQSNPGMNNRWKCRRKRRGFSLTTVEPVQLT